MTLPSFRTKLIRVGAEDVFAPRIDVLGVYDEFAAADEDRRGAVWTAAAGKDCRSACCSVV